MINEVKTKQEPRLSFDVSYIDAIKYNKEDFQLGIKLLIDNIGMKTKYVDESTETSHEVCLQIPGVQELVLYLANPYSQKRKCTLYI